MPHHIKRPATNATRAAGLMLILVVPALAGAAQEQAPGIEEVIEEATADIDEALF